MNLRLAVVLATVVSAGPGAAQTSQPPAPSSAPPQQPFEREVSWKHLLPNLVSDQARIWSFPARAVRGQDWIPAAAVVGTAAGLTALDPFTTAWFRRTGSFHGFNSIFTGNGTAIGTLAAPFSLYAAGWIRKDSKMEKTALLAGEAVADSEVVATVLKDSLRRVRPAAVPPKGNLSDTWFESGGSLFRGSGSFPSGHTIAAFSIATVVARRYGNHRWVPYAAYGMATLVGFSRLTLLSHFASDVFTGCALGYSISRFAVLRQ